MADDTTTRCPECGACYDSPDDSCAARFDALLALDHSRREPWGSRHGLAFSAYVLQHPTRFATVSLDQSWRILHRVYVAGDDAADVIHALAGRPTATSASWDVPPRPAPPAGCPTVTIADLGTFAAADYPSQLDAWCRATVAWWRA